MALGTSQTFGQVVLRYPRSRFLDDGIDEKVDAVKLLKQEAAILSELSSNDLPVPRVVGMIEQEEGACLVLEFLQEDGSSLHMAEVGRLLRGVHALPPPIRRTVAQTEATLNETIAALIERRLGRFCAQQGRKFCLPSAKELLEILNAWQGRASLLHMDVRPDNFVVKRGRVIGMLDWSNALIGDPWLDLLRTEEFGSANDAFWQGYGVIDDRPPASVEIVFRLYTVVMLCLLFTELIPDAKAAKQAINRLDNLSAELRRMT